MENCVSRAFCGRRSPTWRPVLLPSAHTCCSLFKDGDLPLLCAGPVFALTDRILPKWLSKILDPKAYEDWQNVVLTLGKLLLRTQSHCAGHRIEQLSRDTPCKLPPSSQHQLSGI